MSPTTGNLSDVQKNTLAEAELRRALRGPTRSIRTDDYIATYDAWEWDWMVRADECRYPQAIARGSATTHVGHEGGRAVNAYRIRGQYDRCFRTLDCAARHVINPGDRGAKVRGLGATAGGVPWIRHCLPPQEPETRTSGLRRIGTRLPASVRDPATTMGARP